MTQAKVGDRIMLLQMENDPNPIEVGSLGTVTAISSFLNDIQISVKWDSGRTLSLVCPPDKYEVLK